MVPLLHTPSLLIFLTMLLPGGAFAVASRAPSRSCKHTRMERTTMLLLAISAPDAAPKKNREPGPPAKKVLVAAPQESGAVLLKAGHVTSALSPEANPTRQPFFMAITPFAEYTRYQDTALAGMGLNLRFRVGEYLGWSLSGSLLFDQESERRDIKIQNGVLLYFYKDSNNFMRLYGKISFSSNIILLPDSYPTSQTTQTQIGGSFALGADYTYSKYLRANFQAGYETYAATPGTQEDYGMLKGQRGWFVRFGIGFGFDTTIKKSVEKESPPAAM